MPRMDASALIAKYDRNVPRYTSYPTAPHFTAAVEPDSYAQWLRSLPAGTPLSLYLHVPFCASLCLFCACHTTVVRRQEPLLGYGESLIQEIRLVARHLGRRLPVQHVHWGGGTPTSLPAGMIRTVMQQLRASFPFAADAEIAMEIDPRELPAGTIEVLQEIGVTRASIGVQDFDPQVQQTINRLQSFECTARCADRLRAAGVRSINLDLIYGLPHQTVGGVIGTVTQALRIRPDRIAVFGYAHVPWMKRHQRLLPEEALPGRSQRYAQREAAGAVITMHGYQPVGMDHFALPDDQLALAAASGRLHRNFQGYTTDDAPVLLGFGASAIGRLPQGYIQNQPRIPLWRQALRTETLPVVRGVALTAADRLRAGIIEQIMCTFEADLEQIAARHGALLADLMDAAPALQEMARDGIIDWDGTRLRVTNAGRPFVRSIAAAFDAYWQPEADRHSAAV